MIIKICGFAVAPATPTEPVEREDKLSVIE
jgi:hypothetical protein